MIYEMACSTFKNVVEMENPNLIKGYVRETDSCRIGRCGIEVTQRFEFSITIDCYILFVKRAR